MKTPASASRPRIVVIEDNHETADNIVAILELARYSVVTAYNGSDGVEVVRDTHPDLVLCDITMPGMDGYGVLKELHSYPETSTIPFVFLTGKSDFSEFRRGMNAGADDYVTKPFNTRDLLKVIETRLRKRDIIAFG